MAGTATADVIWATRPMRELTDTLLRRSVARRAVVAVEPTCACGQALDCYHSAHCPRCGVTLRA